MEELNQISIYSDIMRINCASLHFLSLCFLLHICFRRRGKQVYGQYEASAETHLNMYVRVLRMVIPGM